jgi:cellulose biosynthesis protein BcsE
MEALFTAGPEESAPPADSPSAGFSLGFSEMPAIASTVSPGRAYSLTIQPALGHARLLSSILQANLAAGARCTLVTPMSPEMFLRRCDPEREKELFGALESGQCRLLTMTGDYKKNIVRFGPEKILQELTQCGLEEGSLLIVDHAEQIFSLHHKDTALEQLKTYQQWLERLRSTALLLFSAAAEDAALSGGHRLVADNSSGSARLDYQRTQAELWVDFWQTDAGTMAERRIALAGPHAAELQSPPQADRAPALVNQVQAAEDADEVYFIGDSLAATHLQKPGSWKEVHTLVGLIHATRQARAATVIISVTKDTDSLQLAQTVHIMRLNAGPMLRIVIIDAGLSLRYHNEALLLRLGVNMVVHDPASIARLPLLLESLQAQLYVRNKQISFEDALASATPPRVKGYLPPPVFCDKVRATLYQSRTLNVPCALIMLNHAPTYDQAASLKRFHLSRQGDLLTACPTHCYVFLYGFASADSQAFLPRLLGLHDTRSIRDLTFLNKEEDILVALERIAGAVDPNLIPAPFGECDLLLESEAGGRGGTNRPLSAAWSEDGGRCEVGTRIVQ